MSDALKDLGLKFKEVDKVPPVKQENRSSKYDPLFEATRESETGKIEIEFKDEDEASSRSGYFRRLLNDVPDIESYQRGSSVFLEVVDPEEKAKARKSRARKEKAAA